MANLHRINTWKEKRKKEEKKIIDEMHKSSIKSKKPRNVEVL